MQLQSDLSKSYIAEALLQLMRTKRFSSITNKNITDRAGVSHITIYRNFSSKEDIIRYYLNSILNVALFGVKMRTLLINYFLFFKIIKKQ